MNKTISSVIILLIIKLNIAYSQHTTQITHDGTWESSATWNTPPAWNIGANDVTINHSITKSGDLHFQNGSQNTTISGGNLTITGTMKFWDNIQGNIIINDTLIVKEDIEITSNGTGKKIIIANSAVLLVAGDLSEANYNNLEVHGTLVVGGDLNIGNQNSGSGKIYVNGSSSGNFNSLPGDFHDLANDDPDLSTYFTTNLPVSLISFEGEKLNNDRIELTWYTASEINNSHFEIYSSLDKRDWKLCGYKGGSGNSNVEICYKHQLEAPKVKEVFYKLVQYDFDMKKEEFGPIKISLSHIEKPKVKVYPSVSSDYINIVSVEGGNYSIYTSSGKFLNTYNHMDNKKLDISFLSKGVYILKTKNSSTLFIKE